MFPLPLPPENLFAKESGGLLYRTFHGIDCADCIPNDAV